MQPGNQPGGQQRAAEEEIGVGLAEILQAAVGRRTVYDWADGYAHSDRRRYLAVADLLVQAGGFRRRLDAQFQSELAPAGFVLRQSRAALAAERQQPHQLTVTLLQPRFQFNLSPGILAGLLNLSAGFVVFCQTAQCADSLAL